MKRHWWKVLSVLILVYTLIIGMVVPLRTGITMVSPSSIKTGKQVTFQVEGYNSNFKNAAGQNRVWLKLTNDFALKATDIEVINNRYLNATFDIPAHLPIDKKLGDAAMIIDNPLDGGSVLPSAVFLTQDSIAAQSAIAAWSVHPIENLHNKPRLTFPFRNILSETIRNTYYHVPLWFSMLFIFLAGVIYSIKYLRKMNPQDDLRAAAFTKVGILLGIMGVVTGAIWANYTWGKPWSWDIKQNMTAIALLIYLAYFVLRSSFEDPERKARLSAVYNVFAFATIIPLLYVIPRMADSLHPGSGGNPAFGGEDLDRTMRLVFYPAIIGWTLLGLWLSNLTYRMSKIERHFDENED